MLDVNSATLTLACDDVIEDFSNYYLLAINTSNNLLS